MIRCCGASLFLAGLLAIFAGGSAALAVGEPCPGCSNPHPEETFICGCLPASTGEIGARVAAGNVTESIVVPVVAQTVNAIDAFGFDLAFPDNLIRYDSTTVGKATEHFDFFDSQLLPGGVVRVGAFEIGPDTVSTGVAAIMALVHFTVIAPGCDSFALTSLFDDLGTYTTCDFASAVGAPAPTASSPSRLPVLSAQPNPFDASIAIDFTLPAASRVWIDVYDPAGRKVVSLVEGGAAAAHGRHVWGGLDRNGKPVPAGVYFVRLRTETASKNMKVLRVR
jgi:hypothetical protein